MASPELAAGPVNLAPTRSYEGAIAERSVMAEHDSTPGASQRSTGDLGDGSPRDHTARALLDLHERCHQSLGKFIGHCAAWSQEEIDRELPGFGYPSVRLQIHHVIGAEEYWVGVIRGAFRAEDDAHEFPTIASLESYRQRIAASTADYLRAATVAELNTRRTMLTWTGREHAIVPAHVILRTQTHFFHHEGQIAAMARLIGRPVPPGFDFPLD